MVRVRASSSHGVSSSYFLPRMHFVPDGRVLALIDRRGHAGSGTK